MAAFNDSKISDKGLGVDVVMCRDGTVAVDWCEIIAYLMFHWFAKGKTKFELF